jgi:hypothetical protein
MKKIKLLLEIIRKNLEAQIITGVIIIVFIAITSDLVIQHTKANKVDKIVVQTGNKTDEKVKESREIALKKEDEKIHQL